MTTRIRAVSTVRIPTPANFVFQSTVVSHGWYVLAPFRWTSQEQVLRRAEVIGRRACDLEIAAEPGALTIRGAPDGRELRAKIGRMFQLNVDTSGFIGSSDIPRTNCSAIAVSVIARSRSARSRPG